MLRFKSLLIILLSALVVAGIAFAGIALLGPTKADDDEIEEEVSLSDVPAIVLDAANEAVPGGEIEEVEKEVEDGEIIYKVEKIVEGAEYEIEVTAEGVVKEVEKDDEDDDDED